MHVLYVYYRITFYEEKCRKISKFMITTRTRDERDLNLSNTIGEKIQSTNRLRFSS